VMEAAAGRAFNPVPLDLSSFSAFQQKVLKILQQVPRGEVRTYGWLARKAGRPKAARAVGNAMASNPIPFLIPCHRVVPAAGGVGNYGLGSRLKRELLQREGVDVDQL
jgi:methylated-DNA-[protein]-cysteine S-methyltransferase